MITHYAQLDKPPVDFVEFDFLKGVLDPRITFTRSSTATYFDANGVMQTAAANTPRLDHDPVTKVLKGLLVEEQRTNMFLQSASLTAPFGFSRGTITPNAADGPAGPGTAFKLTANSETNPHMLHQAPVTAQGTTYTLSFYAKAAEWNGLQIVCDGGNKGGGFRFDLMTAPSGGTITDVGNGWRRCTYTFVASVATGAQQVSFRITLDGAQNAAGDGTTGIFFYGPQMEVGAYATSYIPTTTATVTRAAENFTCTNLPAMRFNNQAATLFIDADRTAWTSSNGIFLQVAGTLTGGCFGIYNGPGNGLSYDAVLTVAIFSGNDLTAKIAFTCNSSSYRIARRGQLGPTGNANLTSKFPLYTRLVGSSPVGLWRKIRYYPRRLSDTELQEITAP